MCDVWRTKVLAVCKTKSPALRDDVHFGRPDAGQCCVRHSAPSLSIESALSNDAVHVFVSCVPVGLVTRRRYSLTDTYS